MFRVGVRVRGLGVEGLGLEVRVLKKDEIESGFHERFLCRTYLQKVIAPSS
jgi:hypothetical protein